MEVDDKRLNDDIVSELCEPCQEGNMSKQADGYCIDCEEHMCQACFQRHLKLKLCRNHVLGAVNGLRKQGTQSQAEKCKKHETENVKYYCHKHDSVACGDCLLLDHRKCEPEPELIRDLAKNIEESSDFTNILKEVKKLEDFKAEIELALGRNRNENTEFHDKAIHEIQKCRTEINTWLDNVTSKIETEEMAIWKKNEVIMSKLEDWIQIITDMIDELRDEISPERYASENLFVRVIRCKSKLSEFCTKSVPEIKSNIEIKPFAFKPNQKLCVFTKSASLGIIRVSGEELQTSQEQRQNDMTCIKGASIVVPSNLPEHEDEVVKDGERCTLKSPEDPVRVGLETELEKLRNTTRIEKKEKEALQQPYDTLKKELDDQESLLSREREDREKYVLEIKEFEQTIVLLRQEVSSLNELNTSLQSQVDSCNNEFDVLESTYKARQEQDNNKIKSLQSELSKISEKHEMECKRLSSQIQDLQHQIESVVKTYQLPDPRAAGFDVGKRVESTLRFWEARTGTVTAVYPSGYVDVRWDNRKCSRCIAGAGEEYDVKLL